MRKHEPKGTWRPGSMRDSTTTTPSWGRLHSTVCTSLDSIVPCRVREVVVTKCSSRRRPRPSRSVAASFCAVPPQPPSR
eukprot:scaffold2655_cov400-Prasinococcus_capsulatus_cf.AAC.10